jgi:hypothetical protein
LLPTPLASSVALILGRFGNKSRTISLPLSARPAYRMRQTNYLPRSSATGGVKFLSRGRRTSLTLSRNLRREPPEFKGTFTLGEKLDHVPEEPRICAFLVNGHRYGSRGSRRASRSRTLDNAPSANTVSNSIRQYRNISPIHRGFAQSGIPRLSWFPFTERSRGHLRVSGTSTGHVTLR